MSRAEAPRPEFSRLVRLDEIGKGLTRDISASELERAALARRFGLVAITFLSAEVTLRPVSAGVCLTGRVTGRAIGTCVVSAEDVAQQVDETFELTLTPHGRNAGRDEEVELGETDLDTLQIENGRIDIGEAAAASFALALEPYPRADAVTIAEARRHLLSEEEAAALTGEEERKSSPFAALKGRE